MFVIYVITFVCAVSAILWIGTEIHKLMDARRRERELTDSIAGYGPPTDDEVDAVKSELRAGSFRLGASASAASRHFAHPTPQTRVRGGARGGEEQQVHKPSTSVASWRDDRIEAST